MKIYTRAGELVFSMFTFPDGQPHFKLETCEREFDEVTIETAITSSVELFQVVLVSDVLRNNGYSRINLDIRYLMGARMDRSISVGEPFTLQCVARLINNCGFTHVRILDAHSEVATRLIRNSSNVLPINAFTQAAITSQAGYIMAPDAGARPRVEAFAPEYYWLLCRKRRDPNNGNLSQFIVPAVIPEGNILIVDDICDGGATFIGLTKVILEKKSDAVVNLFVTHGIFSKGTQCLLDAGIKKIYTTDSYRSCQDGQPGVITIPVSMKDM